MFWKRKASYSFNCSICGEEHQSWPAMVFDVPLSYHVLSEDQKKSMASIDADFCEISMEDEIYRFIRVSLRQKLVDSNFYLEYGLWVSLSAANFSDYREHFEDHKYEANYFGWLNNNVPPYQNTMNIPTKVLVKSGTERPEIILDSTYSHRFVVDYYQGISKSEAEKRLHAMFDRIQ